MAGALVCLETCMAGIPLYGIWIEGSTVAAWLTDAGGHIFCSERLGLIRAQLRQGERWRYRGTATIMQIDDDGGPVPFPTPSTR